MTNYYSTANYIFNLVLQVLLTAYLTWEMLLYGRVGWAVALVLVTLAAIGINLYIWINVKRGGFPPKGKAGTPYHTGDFTGFAAVP